MDLEQFLFFNKEKNGSTLRTGFKYEAICENNESKNQIIYFSHSDCKLSLGLWLYVHTEAEWLGPSTVLQGMFLKIYKHNANGRAVAKTWTYLEISVK